MKSIARQKQLQRILEQRKREYSKGAQWIEYLKRNKQFQDELKAICNRLGGQFFKLRHLEIKDYISRPTKCPLVKMDYPKVKYIDIDSIAITNRAQWHDAVFNSQDPSIKFEKPKSVRKKLAMRFDILTEYKNKWNEFCTRYCIIPRWNGKLRELSDCVYSPVVVMPPFDVAIESRYIDIAVDRWADFSDVQRIWHVVEEIQGKMGRKLFATTNFSRDLCWRDLSIDCGLKPREIAELWNKHYPDDIDVLTVSHMKREGNISREDLKGKAIWDDNQTLCKEIKSGFLREDYHLPFLELRKWYTQGIVERGGRPRKFQVPLEDTIRKAIKRMQQNILSIGDNKSKYKWLKP